jgi:5-methylcytosine-specific restriction endonuclease McrA
VDYKDRNREHQRNYYARLSPEQRKEANRKKYARRKELHGGKTPSHWGSAWSKKNKAHTQASTAWATYVVRDNLNTDFTRESFIEWVKVNRGKPCPICGDEATHIDHILARSKGGQHTQDNLQMLCGTCNRAKHNLLMEEFLSWVNRLKSFNQKS